MPKTLEHDFLLTDETVNRYGFRVLVEGIDTAPFEKNPVCLVQHGNQYFSVGKWKNLKKESGVFKATLEFDSEDDIAVKLYNKYKNGYMSAVSISFIPLAESEDPKLLLAGQKYPTVVTSELTEISLVNVPGNSNAVKLVNREGSVVSLSLIMNSSNQKPIKMADETKTPEQLAQENESLRKKLACELVAYYLGAKAITPEEKDFFEKSAHTDYDGTKKVLELRKPAPESKQADNADTQKKLAEQLVELHFTRGAITDAEKDFYVKSAIGDYDGTKKVLELRKGKDTLDIQLQNMGSNKEASDSDDRAKWSYLDYYKNDLEGLLHMKAQKPEEYKKLLDTHKLSLAKSGDIALNEE